MAKRKLVKKSRKRVVHYGKFEWAYPPLDIPEAPTREWVRNRDGLIARAACGKRLLDRHNFPTKDRVTQYQAPTCTECLRQYNMTAQQHIAYLAQQKANLAPLREKQKTEADAKRAQELAERKAFVDKYRDEALVAQDAYLSGLDYEHMGEVLQAAMVMHRLVNPSSRGTRLWKTVAAKNKFAMITESDVMCRFCDCKLGFAHIGQDVTNWWFASDGHGDRWEDRLREYADTVLAKADAIISVSRHTTLCALAYLAGTECVEKVPW